MSKTFMFFEMLKCKGTFCKLEKVGKAKIDFLMKQVVNFNPLNLVTVDFKIVFFVFIFYSANGNASDSLFFNLSIDKDIHISSLTLNYGKKAYCLDKKNDSVYYLKFDDSSQDFKALKRMSDSFYKINNQYYNTRSKEFKKFDSLNKISLIFDYSKNKYIVKMSNLVLFANKTFYLKKIRGNRLSVLIYLLNYLYMEGTSDSKYVPYNTPTRPRLSDSGNEDAIIKDKK